jgi:sirohydrochlorin cobaltochelatase
MTEPTADLTGVLLCGHGSRDAGAVAEFASLAAAMPAHLPPDWLVAHGYLEFANPVLRDGLDLLRDRGVRRILAVPGMLFAAMHSKNDIPTVLQTWSARTGVPVSYGRELGVDPRMVAAAAARVREAVAAADAATGPVALHDTCLVVIGRGASDPTRTATWPRSHASCGRAWGWAGARSATPASPSRWSSPA